MGEIEEFLGRDIIFVHQALQRGSIAAVIVFLECTGRNSVNSEEIAKIQRDPLIDLRPKGGFRRIQRVIEIKNPDRDIGEGFLHIGR